MNFQDFVNWALAQGSVAKTNGEYLGECVSLINQYCHRVLGVPASAWGHAKDWAVNAAPLKYFKIVNDPQEGDILVYGPEFGGGFGHIEIVLNDTESLFQNRNGNRKVGYGKRLPEHYAVLRLKDEYKQVEPAKIEPPKFIPMDEPRVMLALQDLHKFNPDTKKFSDTVTFPAGELRWFQDKVIVDGKTYLRTKHDYNRGNRAGFEYDKKKLRKLPPVEEIIKVLEETG